MWAAGTVNQPDLPPEIEEGLQMVCRNVELEARLIDDLLDLTRITRGKLQLHVRRADAHELLRHTIDIVQSEIDSQKLTLALQLEAIDHEILVDPPRLQQVFWNILRNAAKYSPPLGSISVRTFNSAPQQLAIEIKDSGIGIEAEFLDKIFDAFEQLGTRREGLGLGLAISKAVVEMHCGTIRAFSEGAGKGATFLIELATAKAS
jgi:signal transduction histidine kinase